MLDNNRSACRERPYWNRKYSPPCLAVVLCNDDPASEIYVQRKREACEEVGINSYLLQPFEGGINNWFNPENHLLNTIEYLNEDPSINGILVQLPLPKHIDAKNHPD